MKSSSVLLAVILTSWSFSAPTCSPVWGRGIDKFFSEAQSIVIAKAVGYGKYDPQSINVYAPHKSTVRFKVIEVLAGNSRIKSLEIVGALNDCDDFNDGQIPFQMVRPNGRHGACYAYHYRTGALYLLVLKKQHRQLSPYWDPLKPSNEQIHSVSDPWVSWVKAYLDHIRQVS